MHPGHSLVPHHLSHEDLYLDVENGFSERQHMPVLEQACGIASGIRQSVSRYVEPVAVGPLALGDGRPAWFRGGCGSTLFRVALHVVERGLAALASMSARR